METINRWLIDEFYRRADDNPLYQALENGSVTDALFEEMESVTESFLRANYDTLIDLALGHIGLNANDLAEQAQASQNIGVEIDDDLPDDLFD